MKVQDVLTSEAQWTKEANARGEDGEERMIHSMAAVQFCLYGAIERAYGEDHGKQLAVVKRVNDFLVGKGYEALEDFNDDPKTTFEDVRRLVVELDV